MFDGAGQSSITTILFFSFSAVAAAQLTATAVQSAAAAADRPATIGHPDTHRGDHREDNRKGEAEGSEHGCHQFTSASKRGVIRTSTSGSARSRK